MKQWMIWGRSISFCVLVVAAGCSSDGPNNSDLTLGQPAVIEWQDGDVIAALGTSLTFGFGAGCKVLPLRSDCAADSSYPALLEARLKLPIINFGRPGATTRDGLLRVDEALARNPVLVFLEFGANDLIGGIAVDEARENLREMVDRFHAPHSGQYKLASLHAK